MTVKKNKIGAHFMHVFDANEMVAIINNLNCAVVKFAFTPPDLIRQVMERCPDVIGIYRMWWQYDGYLSNSNDFLSFRNYMGSRGKGAPEGLSEEESRRDTLGNWFNPREAVNELYFSYGLRGNTEGLLAFPDSVKRRLYVEGHNETGGGGKVDFFRFEKARCDWAKENGFRACVINGGVGWTYDWLAADSAGLLETLERDGHLLGTHGYGHVLIDISHGDFQPLDSSGTLAHPLSYYLQNRQLAARDMTNSWLAFRCVKYDQQLKALGYHNIKQVLTEFGLDRSASHIIDRLTDNREVGSWKTTVELWRSSGLLGDNTPDVFYAKELLFAEKQLRRYDDFLLGATVFTVGSAPESAWTAFDVRGTQVLPALAALTTAEPFTDEPPQTFCAVTPAKDFAINIRSFPDIEFGDGSLAGQMAVGQEMRVYGKFRDAENRLWYVLNEEKTKWVSSAAAIRLTGNCASIPDVTYEPPAEEPPPPDVAQLLEKIRQLETENAALKGQLAALNSKFLDAQNAVTNALAYIASGVSELKKVIP